MHVRYDDLGQVVSKRVVIVTGTTATGPRKVLGVGVGIGDLRTRPSGPGSCARAEIGDWAGRAS